MTRIPTIETQRLVLRPFAPDDAPRLRELMGDRLVAETYSEIPYPYEKGMAEAWIPSHAGAFERGERLILAIVLRSSQELLGGIGLEFRAQHRSAEMGYWIGTPYWNRGFATEAATALLQYAFDTLELHRVQARHMTKNPASGRVLQKIGMAYEGTLKQSLLRFGEFEDAAIYGIVRK